MVIGVDVGLDGAICVKDGDNIQFHKMPTVKIDNDSVYKRWYDIPRIYDILQKCDDVSLAILEYQRPISGQSMQSMFRLGRGFGVLEALLTTRFSKVLIIDPKKWQHQVYKKYLSEDALAAFDSYIEKASETIEEPYRSIFKRKMQLKSTKTTKLKTFYCIYESGVFNKIDLKHVEKHDCVDALAMCLYGEIILSQTAS